MASIAFDHIKHHQKLIEPSRLQRENFQLLKIFRRWIGTSRLKMNEWMCQCIFLWWIFCRLLLMNHRNANHVLLCALNWEINAHFYTPLCFSQLSWDLTFLVEKCERSGLHIQKNNFSWKFKWVFFREFEISRHFVFVLICQLYPIQQLTFTKTRLVL